MKDYGMPMEFNTMAVWNKLSGGKPLSDYPKYDRTEYETEQVYIEQRYVVSILEKRHEIVTRWKKW